MKTKDLTDKDLDSLLKTLGIKLKYLTKTECKVLFIQLLQYTTEVENWEYITNKCLKDLKDLKKVKQ